MAAHPFEYEGHAFRMSVTLGVARFRRGQTIDEWIDAADKKLYVGKTTGKNRLVR
ncbi:MAG: diguanylate cyclase [Clostridia bacterium]|nr:diguanylate cyclase [Clostridia bacterium]